jgi:hypothetical protein
MPRAELDITAQFTTKTQKPMAFNGNPRTENENL